MEKKPLGEGSYGQVCKGVHKDTGAVRAIKALLVWGLADSFSLGSHVFPGCDQAINRHKISDPARFQVEVDIQSSLDHPNIVKLYEAAEQHCAVFIVWVEEASCLSAATLLVARSCFKVFQDAKRFYLVQG